MNTYKIGNKIKCIVRCFSSGEIGNIEMRYNNQPYTVLKDVEAEITFKSINSDIVTKNNVLSHNIDNIDEIKFSNITLTDKILNLIFHKNKDKLCNTVKNFTSNNNKEIFIPLLGDENYQVFVYDNEGQLEQAFGSLNTPRIEVKKANSSYLVFYSFLGKESFLLNKSANYYLTLDLEIQGNKSDQTSDYWIHLDKCCIQPEKNLMFRTDINSIDLNFKVLHSDNDYITIN